MFGKRSHYQEFLGGYGEVFLCIELWLELICQFKKLHIATLSALEKNTYTK